MKRVSASKHQPSFMGSKNAGLSESSEQHACIAWDNLEERASELFNTYQSFLALKKPLSSQLAAMEEAVNESNTQVDDAMKVKFSALQKYLSAEVANQKSLNESVQKEITDSTSETESLEKEIEKALQLVGRLERILGVQPLKVRLSSF